MHCTCSAAPLATTCGGCCAGSHVCVPGCRWCGRVPQRPQAPCGPQTWHWRFERGFQGDQFRLGNQRPNLSQSSAPHRAQCDIAAHGPNVRRSTPADMHRALRVPGEMTTIADNRRTHRAASAVRGWCHRWRAVAGPATRPLRRLPPVSAHWPKRYGSDEAISLRVVLKHNALNSAGTLLKARCCIQAGAVWRHQRCRQTPWTDLTGWPTPHASPCIKSDARTQATSRMPTPHSRRRAHDRPPQDDANRRPTSRNAPPHPDAAADPGRRLRQAAASTSGEATALLLQASRDATRAAQPLPARPR